MNENFRVKHGAQVRWTLRSGDRVLEEMIQNVEDGVHDPSTMWSIMYNALGVSGGVRWRHPGTGEYFNRAPQVRFSIVNPDDVLTGDQECDCPKCEAD